MEVLRLIATDTIAAIATARGEASVGIVRVSGSDARRVGEHVFRTPTGKQVKLRERSLFVGTVIHPETAMSLDEAILLWMPGPKSYTAEDVVELQVHGGIHMVEAILDAVLQAGARMAEPGEFTKRAFLNGRMDLSQAEAVIDLIRSKTDLASQAALQQVRGQFRDKIRSLRRDLIHLQAHVEVMIDYPEHDVEAVARQQVQTVVEGLLEEVKGLLEGAKMGKILREGISTVIVGRPNVGKSSLMNRLLRRDRAIVTDIPGTTRDVLEEYVNIHGIPFRVVDTAGIRETMDIVERIGVERSREVLQGAELAILVLNGNEALTDNDRDLLSKTSGMSRLIVINKADLPGFIDVDEVKSFAAGDRVLLLSVQRTSDMALLERAMVDLVSSGSVHEVDLGYLSNKRQESLLRDVHGDLRQAYEAAEFGATLDLIAVQLQAAYRSLGLVIGEETGEDLLDEIFSQFCLGK